MTPVSRQVISEDNPWPGLESFDEAAMRFFNGRRTETAELRRLVLNASLTTLFGTSGLGKTSLLRAGLFPILRRDGVLPVYVRLKVRDRSAPLMTQAGDCLESEIRAMRVDTAPMNPGESLWEYLHRAGLEFWSAQNRLLTPLFVFDQFEEVFTLGADNPGAIQRWRTDLADLIENRIPAACAESLRANEAAVSRLSLDSRRYRVLLSLREDYLPALEAWKREIPSLLRSRLRLLPMTEEQAFEAVHTTAPHLADAAMARKIVSFVAAAQYGKMPASGQAGERLGELSVEPALLSLVCEGLNRKRKSQSKPAFDEALLAGTGRLIVADFYNTAVRDLPARVQEFIDKELITERGFRRQYAIDDARSLYGIDDQQIGTLVERRVLRIEPHPGTDRIELIHDLLTPVVREHRDQERDRQRKKRQRKIGAIIGGIGMVLAVLVVVFLELFLDARSKTEELKKQTEVADQQTGLRGIVWVKLPVFEPQRPFPTALARVQTARESPRQWHHS